MAETILYSGAAHDDDLANLPPEMRDHPKYRMVRKLGGGGMGVVYEALHSGLARRVAIKVINPAVLTDADALSRFQSEVRATGRLEHENIVRAYDTEKAGNLHLLVMELVDGKNLADVVQSKGPLSIARACHCVGQAALGLQYANHQGMVHHDIKPSNLMVTAAGKVKILNFGLAWVLVGITGSGLPQADVFPGTPEYVSPEQSEDARNADGRSDIYSLGCALYYLLTGRPPFEERCEVTLLMAHRQQLPSPLHQVRPDVPRQLSAVAARMLAKKPAQRYQRPADVARALVPFMRT